MKEGGREEGNQEGKVRERERIRGVDPLGEQARCIKVNACIKSASVHAGSWLHAHRVLSHRCKNLALIFREHFLL